MFEDELDLREQSKAKLEEVLLELKKRGRRLTMPRVAEMLCMEAVWDMMKIQAKCDATKLGSSPAEVMLHKWASEMSSGPDPWQMGQKQILIIILDEWANQLVPFHGRKISRPEFVFSHLE